MKKIILAAGILAIFTAGPVSAQSQQASLQDHMTACMAQKCAGGTMIYNACRQEGAEKKKFRNECRASFSGGKKKS